MSRIFDANGRMTVNRDGEPLGGRCHGDEDGARPSRRGRSPVLVQQAHVTVSDSTKARVHDRAVRRLVATQSVRGHLSRYTALPVQQLAEIALGRPPVASRLKDNIDSRE
jgi:hypothetical protein